MKLLDVSCPHCGAGMKVTDNAKTVHCEYCNHDFIIDDEAIHIAHHIENAEQLGYEIEAGRNRYKREQEEREMRSRNGLCPHCGAIVYVDTADTTETCHECHKEFNVEASVLFGLARSSSEFGDSATDALDYYDKALELQSDGAMLIEQRNEFRGNAFWGWLIGGIVIFAVLFFFVDSTALVAVGFIAFLIALFAFRNNDVHRKEKQQAVETASITSNSDTNGYVLPIDCGDNDSYDAFHEFDTPPIIPTPEICMDKLSRLDDLVAQNRDNEDALHYLYERQAEWERLLFEAETEEEDM